MKRMGTAGVLLLVALVPLAVLAALAIAGARAHVGVVTTGVGGHAVLGVAWVAAWLTAVVISPIVAVASAIAAAATWLTPARGCQAYVRGT
jgi:hypothetical protein